MLILIADPFDAGLPAQLAAFGEVTEDHARLPEVEVVLVRSKTKVTREYLDRARKLELLIRGGVGLDNVDCTYAQQRGVLVRNTPDASTVAVAELAMALMLAAINRIVDAHNGMAAGKWPKNQIKRTELWHKTLGLIGVGRIGTAVAQRARAFEMEVIGHDPFVTASEFVGLKSLDEVLAESDVLSLHAPLTGATRGLLDAARLAKTKRGVVIVNTGRGPVVDEVAMAAAIRDGHVRSYATDVWSSDPPPADCPLVGLPGVVMAPHIGASSHENLLRIGDETVRIIHQYLTHRT